MKIRSAALLVAIFALAAIGFPTAASAQQTSVTAAVEGLFPAGTIFNGVSLTALQSGSGLEVGGVAAAGQFCAALSGSTAAGPRTIIVDGRVTGGTRLAANVVTFSGTCTLDMGDGLPPLGGVPFTVTLTTNENEQGTVGLALGTTSLPAATVSQGSMTIR